MTQDANAALNLGKQPTLDPYVLLSEPITETASCRVSLPVSSCARQRAVSLIKLRNDISQSIPGIEAYRTSSELVVSAVRYMLVRCWFANSPRRDTETPQLLSVDLSVVIPLACQIVTRLLLRQLSNRFRLKKVIHRRPTSRNVTISVC